MYEFVQCVITNFDPVTMTVTLPDLFSNIKVEKPELMEIVSSHNLPRTRISIQANQMIGPSNIQQTTKKSIATQDIIKNLHTNSVFSHLKLDQAMLKLNEFFLAVENGQTTPPEEHFSRLFKDALVDAQEEDYPDVFKELFFDLIRKPEMNETNLKLLLMIACEGGLTTKM